MKTKNFSSYVIAYIVIIILYTIVNVVFFLIEDHSFENYSLYQRPIIVGLGVIFGVLSVTTFYYIGKYHDYSKEVIKTRNQFLEYFSKFKFIIEDIKDSELPDRIKNAAKNMEQEIKQLETVDQTFKDQRNLSQNLGSRMIVTSLITAGFLSFTSMIFFLSFDIATQNLFIMIINALLATLGTFLVGWLWNENTLNRLINILDSNYQMVSMLKFFIYKLEKITNYN